MTASPVPVRLIVCVDGTSRSCSGTTETHIHRLYTGVKCGRCVDSSGAAFDQRPLYVPGIGSADDVLSRDRIQANVLGQGYLKQIHEVYEACCQLKSDGDELWLFGYSRGAYVVRAVAGLLHTFGALESAGRPEFAKDFKKIVKESEANRGKSSLVLSPVTSTSTAAARAAAKVRFVGVFDTIKALGEDDPFDVSLNSSIQHLRHALALNEDRKALAPQAVFPDEFYRMNLTESMRSFVQAYFMGDHADLGGVAKKSGLGLYPLQWMAIEASNCGLSFTPLTSQSTSHESLLSSVLPTASDGGEAAWCFTAANGIKTHVRDIRGLHSAGDSHNDTALRLISKYGSIRQKRQREIFTLNGYLGGYCDWAPQGTILHPSVYMLVDEHSSITLEMREVKLQRYLEDWREKMLGSKDGVVNTGFWLDHDDDDAPDPGPLRVLVCGNTGVGKSTLINRTFGVDVTQSSNRTRGIHDVQEEITFDGRPDLIVHDSGGFEAGADSEFLAIERFLQDKSAKVNVSERLHVIWFCIDINSPRTLQTVTEKLFQAVSRYANDVPIVLVATKKDELLDIEFGIHRKALRKAGQRLDEDACDAYAEQKLQERVAMIRSEMESVPGGKLEACVAVSQGDLIRHAHKKALKQRLTSTPDDASSIANLSQTTSHCFDTDKVRLLYIRAQVTRIDLKIDMALCEVNRRYKRLIRDATGSVFAPGGATITRKVSTTAITKKIINCFGLLTVSAEMALDALNTNVWNTLGQNLVLALAEGLHIFGIMASGAMSGIPIFLVSGSINASYIVPATCRLFLIMACDLTFVLARSFKEVTFRASEQPTERDVNAAARNYQLRGYSKHVHKEVKQLVPRRNVVKSFQAEKVQQGLQAIFTTYKDRLMEDVDLPLDAVQSHTDAASTDGDSSTDADSSLFNDVRLANAAVAELDARQPVAELESDATLVELPDNGLAELAHSRSTVKRPVEVAHSPTATRKSGWN
ncbi:hypothetical protein D0863_06191 [Hortaea werneckii]|uniref:DUF2235 domain-containing protein n=1 Tax=Hortaea werneckii TaxID=91943 RepID=A0A3M7DZU5_HORWE|nr:hypothetical protein D0863_06191 [Hortaea werneckii]